MVSYRDRGNQRARIYRCAGGVFGGDATLDGVAADWLQRYEQHEANAVAEVANFVLRCAGCEIEIDGHDVLDTDNATNRLSDIQDEFEAVRSPLLLAHCTY